MSAFHPIADLKADVLGGPLSAISELMHSSKNPLFDHLVGAGAQAPTNHLFLVGFNRSSRPLLVSSCAKADLSNGRMRTPGQGLLAMGSPPSIQQRVHVKTGAFASNVLQSCVSCQLILKSFSTPLPSVHRRASRSSLSFAMRSCGSLACLM